MLRKETTALVSAVLTMKVYTASDLWRMRLKYKRSAVAQIGDRLATIDMGRKEGGCCAPFGGELGPHLI